MWEQSWKRAGDGKGKVRMFVFKLVHAPKGLSHVTIAKPIFIKCKSISAVSDLGRAIRKYCNLVFHLCWLADISVSVWHAVIIKRAWHFTKFGKQMRALGIFSPFKFFSGYINLLSNVTEKLHLHAHTYTRFFWSCNYYSYFKFTLCTCIYAYIQAQFWCHTCVYYR